MAGGAALAAFPAASAAGLRASCSRNRGKVRALVTHCPKHTTTKVKDYPLVHVSYSDDW